MTDEIIAAFATAIGTAGLQVMRVAGTGSAALCDRIFSFGSLPGLADANYAKASEDPASNGQVNADKHQGETANKAGKTRKKTVVGLRGYQAAFGYLHAVDDPTAPIDQCVLTRFKAGRSYTGEEQVELSIHGGNALRRQVLDLVLSAGARLAEPGEFTRWAFMNGKLDLSQAEAVMDLIEADTVRQHKAALQHLEGDTGQKLAEIKSKAYELLSSLEVDIEYPEYEDFQLQSDLVSANLQFIVEELDKIIKNNRQGEVLREGLQLVIVGEPNVGKSSLLNALSGEDRAIVTDIAGTTRDSIELKLDMDGIPLTLYDTAGIRESEDPIEKLGVARAKKLISSADLLLFVLNVQELDALQKEIEEFLRNSALDKDYIVVINKVDISSAYIEKIKHWEFWQNWQKEDPHFIDYIWVSANTGASIPELKKLIIAYYENMSGTGASDLILTSKRQQNLVAKAYAIFADLYKEKDVLPNDILSAGLRQGLEVLGEITGEDVSENMINDIFQRFCIGK